MKFFLHKKLFSFTKFPNLKSTIMKKIYFLFLVVLLAHRSSHAQWTLVTPAFTQAVRGTYFENPDTGYVTGYNGTNGQIAKTTDGGATWVISTLNQSFIIRAISFVNNDTGFACGAFGNNVNGLVYKTEDAGSNWTLIFSDTLQYFRAIDFISPDTGFIAGHNGVILKTTDGGTNWTTTTLSVLPSVDVIQLQMANSQTGYAVCAGAAAPYYPGYVFKTIDGGGTWSQVYNNPNVGLLGLAVIDAATVYAGGSIQTIIKTIDGGATWDTVYVGLTGYAIRGAFAISPDRVYMVDDGDYPTFLNDAHILHTIDGGTTWLNDSTGAAALFSIYFPTPTIGYTGDIFGAVYKFSCVPPAAAAAIIGLDSVCSGSTEQYSIDSVAGADSYNWSVPADAVINSGQGTTTISVTYGVISGDVSVTSVSNSCGDGGAISKSIEVSPSPSPTITFSDSILSSSDPVGNQWYFDGSPIGGATDSTYVPTENGNYYTVVTNSYGCTGASNSIDVIGLGIDNTPGSSLAIFPNPSVDVCMIYFPKIEGGKLRIVNAAGAAEFSENNLSGEMYKLNTASLPSGFHLVRLYDRENHLISTSKLVVQ